MAGQGPFDRPRTASRADVGRQVVDPETEPVPEAAKKPPNKAKPLYIKFFGSAD